MFVYPILQNSLNFDDSQIIRPNRPSFALCLTLDKNVEGDNTLWHEVVIIDGGERNRHVLCGAIPWALPCGIDASAYLRGQSARLD